MKMHVRFSDEFNEFLIANFERDAEFELVINGFELNNGDVNATFHLVNNSDA